MRVAEEAGELHGRHQGKIVQRRGAGGRRRAPHQPRHFALPCGDDGAPGRRARGKGARYLRLSRTLARDAGPQSLHAVKVELRAARAADAAAIADVLLTSRKTFLPYLPSPRSDEEIRAWMRDTVLPTETLTVAVAAGVMVGFLTVRERDGITWLTHRGQSVCTPLSRTRARAAFTSAMVSCRSRSATGAETRRDARMCSTSSRVIER